MDEYTSRRSDAEIAGSRLMEDMFHDTAQLLDMLTQQPRETYDEYINRAAESTARTYNHPELAGMLAEIVRSDLREEI